MVNKVILIGNLGKDPEVRYAASGAAVCSFSMATTEKWSGETKTEWHRIVCFNKLADICGEHLQKGSKVYIEGKLQTRNWEDQSGVKRYTTEIIANQMIMLGSKGEPKQNRPPEPDYPDNKGADDDIPW